MTITTTNKTDFNDIEIAYHQLISMWTVFRGEICNESDKLLEISKQLREIIADLVKNPKNKFNKDILDIQINMWLFYDTLPDFNQRVIDKLKAIINIKKLPAEVKRELQIIYDGLVK